MLRSYGNEGWMNWRKWPASAVMLSSQKGTEMDIESIAKYLYEVGHLKRVKRSGWWLIGIDNPESVAEHVYRTAVLGYILAVLDGSASPMRVACMCLFHDNGETRIGDVNKVTSRYIASKEGEAQAIAEQSARLPESAAEQILALVSEYEGHSSHEGELAHDADQLECMLQAREYVAQGHPQAQDWIDRSFPRLRTDAAKQLAEVCMQMDPYKWWEGLKVLPT
jgi:putative hydrolase of HD superfamily